MYTDIKHIFFDLDDTLYDFEKNSCIALEYLFAEFSMGTKLNVDFHEFYEAYKKVNSQFWSLYNKGQITKQYLRDHRFHETFKKFSYDNFTDNLAFNEQYLTRAPHGAHLREGCIEILEHLKSKYSLHIITNGFKEIQDIKLTKSGIKNYFSNIIVSEEYGFSKPDEKIFRLAETLASGQRNECLMIGDNYESDIEGSLSAGWKAIWLTSNDRSESVRSIKNLYELRAFL
jgi:putative hydrolase of the HAD superfamily